VFPHRFPFRQGFPDVVADQPIEPRHPIFGRFPQLRIASLFFVSLCVSGDRFVRSGPICTNRSNRSGSLDRAPRDQVFDFGTIHKP
jgi:hypothetical protein